MVIKWTTKKPEKMGYYWAYEDLNIMDADVLLIFIARGCEKCYHAGSIWEVNHFSHFIGPLEVPTTPLE